MRLLTVQIAKLQQNRTDWTTFVRAFPELTNRDVDKNQILGPISVPGGGRVPNYIPLYLGSFMSMCPDSTYQQVPQNVDG